jgi:hemerythrin-like domain-containing protein
MLRHASLIPLSHQHQHALALCVQIDRALAAGMESTALAGLVEKVVTQFDSDMRKHFAIEETVLFPRLSACDALRLLVIELLAEHRTMEALRDRLGQAPYGDRLTEFSRLLRLHIRKEEGMLFEQAQRLLSPEQLTELGELLASDRYQNQQHST